MHKERKAGKHRQAAAPVGAAPRWSGALEGVHRGHVYGWAVDAEQPDSRVVLEICVDGAVVGCAVADVARADLAARLAALWPAGAGCDVCHGFIADIGATALRGDGVLTARVANAGTLLSGQLDLADAPGAPAAALSAVFGNGSLRLRGWAIDPDDGACKLTVRALTGHDMVAETVACLSGVPAGPHQPDREGNGFELDLPLALADGRVHSVRVVDEHGRPLNGSPLTVCCHADGAAAFCGDDAVLGALIDDYQRRLPHSLGVKHYRDWSARFDTAPSSSAIAPAAAPRVAVIVSGVAAPADYERSRASLARQDGVALLLFEQNQDASGAAGDSFGALMERALAAGCDALACVRAGDTLAPHALSWAMQGLASPQAQLVYTDSEQAGWPWFKPAWNPEYALASDYPLELLLLRGDAVLAWSAAHALPVDQASLAWSMLAACWTRGAEAIVHVPRVLYHFHSTPAPAERRARGDAARRALALLEPGSMLTPEHGMDAAGAPTLAGCQPRRLRRPSCAPSEAPRVSLIIPTRDRTDLLRRCLDTLRACTDWPVLEIIVADNDSRLPASVAYLREIERQGIRVLPAPGPFNFSAINNAAVAAARGEIVGLINNDIEALHRGWLDEIVSHLLQPGVGAVGAKLLWPNGMVQHGGVLLGSGFAAGHFGNHLADADWGQQGRNQLLQQVGAVTAACLFLRKADYLAVGGMDAHAFPVAFNDVDLCLKLRSRGLRIIWTPHARLLHAESASRGHEDTPPKQARARREMEALRQRWGAALMSDPAYHPSLALDPCGAPFEALALPPRPRAPRLAGPIAPEK